MYLVDVKDFELMQSRMQILEGLSRGEKAVSDNRTFNHSQAKEKMGKWLK